MSTSRLPRRIVIKNYATDYTTTYENVEVDRTRKLDRVFHNKSQKKFFQNDDQLKYVIEYLVLDKGYFMDSDRGGKIVFKNPKDSSIYTFDLNELSCNLEDRVLVGTLD
jgi:hypothetical protein